MNTGQKQELITAAKDGAISGIIVTVAVVALMELNGNQSLKIGDLVVASVMAIIFPSALGSVISTHLPIKKDPRIVVPITTAITSGLFFLLLNGILDGRDSDLAIVFVIMGALSGLITGYRLHKRLQKAQHGTGSAYTGMQAKVSPVIYYVIQPGSSQEGPYDETTLLEAYYAGSLSPDSLVWTDGMQNWASLPESPLASSLNAPATPPPPPMPAPATPPPSPFPASPETQKDKAFSPHKQTKFPPHNP